MKRRQKISFSLPLVFGEAIVSKVHKYDTQWVRLTGQELAEIKIKDLIGDVHFVLEGKTNDKRLWIVTHDDEYQQIRAKYPKDLVMHVGQIYKTFVDPGIVESLLLPIGILEAKAL